MREIRRVLHVTESLAAGVGVAVARLVALQSDAGVATTVLATRRYDTPADDELAGWFAPGVRLVLPRGRSLGRSQLIWLAAALRRELRTGDHDAVHLHSSFAGLVGRLAAVGLIPRDRVFYSPHGFAFLREDLAPTKRAGIELVERALARLGGPLVLVSSSEAEVARRISDDVRLLRNGVDLDALTAVPSPTGPRQGVPTVVMVGRVAYQKAPWRFAEAARRFGDRARFVWLGYGTPEDVERHLGDSPVSVTGRLGRAELLRRLAAADLLFFPTLWEGMPLSLLEAQALGVPAVASDVIGNRDVVVDGRTGFLRDSEAALYGALEQLLDDAERRAAMASAAAEHARRHLSDQDSGRASIALYAGVRQQTSTRGTVPVIAGAAGD